MKKSKKIIKLKKSLNQILKQAMQTRDNKLIVSANSLIDEINQLTENTERRRKHFEPFKTT